ncbi:MAG: alanine racemase [Desulfobacteraceae bacterium]|nr:alanine racemase [Desulfobacteraceae bacterium]
MNPTPLIRAEIDLSAVAHNVRQLRGMVDPGTVLLAAVKANAYGHGAIPVADTAIKNGAGYLGVARLEEAMHLRDNGITAPVLIFGYTPPACGQYLAEHNLTQAVYSLETAAAMNASMANNGRQIKIHLKVDTGMGRLGLDARDPKTVDEVSRLNRLENLFLEGIFTHFATSDSADKSYAHQQFSTFTDFLDHLKSVGITPEIRHAANSGAIIDLPAAQLDMVRAGISVYGLYPSDEVRKQRIALRPVMRLISKIIHLKTVPAGFKVSYGATWEAPRQTTIATVAAGYADGYSRLLSNRGSMLVDGQHAPVVGRVCMDLTMLDVGHIPDVHVEDEVVMIGAQKDGCITADEIAEQTGTINYEVVSSITARVPRIMVT